MTAAQDSSSSRKKKSDTTAAHADPNGKQSDDLATEKKMSSSKKVSDKIADHPDSGGGKPDILKEEQEQLPEGWKVKISKSSGKKYYENKKLKLTQWDPPVEKSIQ